jgi:hypothetical protein
MGSAEARRPWSGARRQDGPRVSNQFDALMGAGVELAFRLTSKPREAISAEVFPGRVAALRVESCLGVLRPMDEKTGREGAVAAVARRGCNLRPVPSCRALDVGGAIAPNLSRNPSGVS